MNEDKKQERYQWLFLQYDSVFDPDWAFALEFQWVSCSGTSVEEFLVRYAIYHTSELPDLRKVSTEGQVSRIHTSASAIGLLRGGSCVSIQTISDHSLGCAFGHFAHRGNSIASSRAAAFRVQLPTAPCTVAICSSNARGPHHRAVLYPQIRRGTDPYSTGWVCVVRISCSCLFVLCHIGTQTIC